jgi:hypothetical protein
MRSVARASVGMGEVLDCLTLYAASEGRVTGVIRMLEITCKKLEASVMFFAEMLIVTTALRCTPGRQEMTSAVITSLNRTTHRNSELRRSGCYPILASKLTL